MRCLVVILAVSTFVTSVLVAAPPRATRAHYLILEIDRDDVITVVSAEEVVMTADIAQATDESVMFDRTERKARNRVDIVVRDEHRQRLFSTNVHVERYRRAEFHGSNDIEGQWLELEKAVFVVRVPARGNERTIELSPRASRRVTHLDLQALPRGPQRDVAPLVLNDGTGNAANRVDILVIGDGYTSAEAAKFQSDTSALMDQFFSIVPYSTYRNYVNVSSYFVPSPQSGADHPYCADGGPDPLEGTFVNTAFDASYCSGGIQRLLDVNPTKLFQAAAAVPDWDQIVVIVNDPMYGGAGGGYSVVSTNQFGVGIVQHEYAHSFSDLADEYTSPYPGFPSCSDLAGQGPACEVNVTNQTSRASIKWNAWIAPSTPVPTPSSYTTQMGLFQGARYSTTAYYRPRDNCAMNSLSASFCAVCAQAYILKLYDGWGGSPASGVDMIEPGSESPSHTTVRTGFIGEAMTFSATILQPVGGPPAAIQWYVDGAPVSGATAASFQWTPTSGGTHTVQVWVRDATTLVHPNYAGSSLQSTRIWSVDVSSTPPPANFVAHAGTGSVLLSWSVVGGASGYEIARAAAGGGFVTIATIAGTVYQDTTVSSNAGYIYKVRAVGGPYCAPDLVVVFTATDDPLQPGTRVKAVHLTELRTAIQAARTTAGIGPATYSRSVAPGTIVNASDVMEMRHAINAARTAAGAHNLAFTDAVLSSRSSLIKSVHIIDLRGALR